MVDDIHALENCDPVLLGKHNGSAHLNGLVNWGMVTRLGAELQNRLGGLAAMQQDLPAGFSLESCAGQALLLAQQDLLNAPVAEQASCAAACRRLSAYLSPIKSSTWSLKADGKKEWNRFG